MKKVQSANLKLYYTPNAQVAYTLEDWIDISLITLLFTLGSALLLATLLQVSFTLPVLLALVFCAVAVAVQRPKLRPWCLPGCMGLALILGLIFLNPVRSAVAAVANSFLQWLSGKTCHVYLQYTGADAACLWQLLLVLLPVIAGFAAYLAVRAKRWGLWILLLPSVLCIAGWLDFSLGAGLLTLGVVWQLLRAVRLQNDGICSSGLLGRIVFVAAVCAVVLPVVLLSADGLTQRSASWRQEMSQAWHAVRYDKSSNSMPEGQLQDLEAWTPDTTPALKVTMELPQKLYLRSYIGEVYADSRWQKLPENVVADHADLFYWLHQNNFYAQGILAEAYLAMGQTQTCSITVENLSACSLRYDLPYAADIRSLADDKMIGDTAVIAVEDSYTAGYYPGSIPQWFALQNELAASNATGSLQTYRVCEEAYHEFTEENYLEIPAETLEIISEELGNPTSGQTLSEIKDTILTYMEENMSYQPYLTTSNGQMDFVTYTLQKSQTGYSVHYATVATLMLRYFGIPARYCEGYFLSGEEAQQYSGNEDIILDETYAHAWTEYYLPGVGWLPFEVTPGYVDKEELEGEGLGGGGRTYTSPQHLPEELQPENEEPAHDSSALNFNVNWLWLLPLVILLAFAIVILLRRLQLRRKLRQIDQATDREAIILRFGYAHWLMRYAGLLPQDEAVQDLDYATARCLQLEALYSTHVISAQQRQQADDFAVGILKLCQQQWNTPRRWYYHWIKCLY